MHHDNNQGSAQDTDWVYYGDDDRQDEDGGYLPSRILVQEPASGPTERATAAVLRELRPPDYGGFGWGYNGHGTSYAAAAILADALELDDTRIALINEGDSDEILAGLREAFCADVLEHAAPRFWLRRGAILRWALGWYTELGISTRPAALSRIPAVHRDWTNH